MLNKFDVLKGLCVSTKARKLFKQENKISFKVAKEANKSQIEDAVLASWAGVKIKKINIINVPGKTKRHGRIKYVSKSYKKAIVTLLEGGSLINGTMSTDA